MIWKRVKDQVLLNGLKLEMMYAHFGISRQGFIKSMNVFQDNSLQIDLIRKEVIQYRLSKDLRAGSRTLYYNLDIKSKYNLGVSKFEKILSTTELTLCTCKTRIVTTKSCARSRAYSNLANGLELSGINQLVVGDLTYIFIDGIRNYVFSLFDVMSARLVGIYGAERMRALEACKALKEFVCLREKKNIAGCIHHTDGGGQYFSDMYLEISRGCGLLPSVAGNCLQNGYAEQRNGMLKLHFLGLKRGRNEVELNKSLQEIKELYNNRKQKGLGWASPIEFEEKLKNMNEKEPKFLFRFTEKLGYF